MRLSDLKPAIDEMPYGEALEVIRKSRTERFVSKKASRTKAVRKKIDKRNALIDMIKSLTPEQKAKLLEELG